MVTALVTTAVAMDVSVMVAVSTTWEVAVTVRVGKPSRPLVTASLTTLREMEEASVTGQIVSVRTIVSVTRTVERASAGSEESSAALVGQLVMVGAHEVTVRTAVVRTVRVVSPAAVAVALGAMVLFANEDTAAADDIADEIASAVAEVAAEEATREAAGEVALRAKEVAEDASELSTDDTADAAEDTEEAAEEAGADETTGAALTTSGAELTLAVVFWARRKWRWRGCE